MAIPSSGPISMQMFNTEFGLGNNLNAYRGKGNMPATGPISFSQLYGATSVIRQPASGDIYNLNTFPQYLWSVSEGFGGNPGTFLSISWEYDQNNTPNSQVNVEPADIPGGNVSWFGVSSSQKNTLWFTYKDFRKISTLTSIKLFGVTYYRGPVRSGSNNGDAAYYGLYRTL